MVSVLVEKFSKDKRTMALTNKPNYSLLQSSLKIDDLIDPRMTTVSSILKHIHKGTIENAYTISNGEYEVIEAEIIETSELTGAEQVCAKRGATPEAQKKFMKTWSDYNDFILKEATDDLSESQPTAGNIAGGLTTIEEKAFGNFQKIGNCKFIDVLEPAEEPTKGKGLYFMDTSSAAAECVTLQAAAGFNIHLFPTGQGNIVGNPIEPVVKLTANPLTVKSMGEHIDCDVSKILSREMNLSEAGDKLIETTLRVANGRLTCAEALGHKEFVMTKLYRSA